MGVFVFVLVDARRCIWRGVAVFDEVGERTRAFSDRREFVIIWDCDEPNGAWVDCIDELIAAFGIQAKSTTIWL